MIHASSIKHAISGLDVAIVGNAESLLSMEHGAAIDDHTHVIRINCGIPDGTHPRSVLGSRMTIWAGRMIPGHKKGKHRHGGIGALFDLTDKQWSALQQMWIWEGEPLIREDHRQKIAVPFKQRRKALYLPYEWTNKPTAGLMTIATALRHGQPRVIHLFGFDWFDTVSWTSNRKHPGMSTPEEHGNYEYGLLRDCGMALHPTLEGVYEIRGSST